MTASLATESELFALELHALLKDIDPARWRSEVEVALRVRLNEARESVAWLLEQAAQHDAFATLNSALTRLRGVLTEDVPPTGLPSAEARRAWTLFSKRLTAAYDELSVQLRSYDIHVPSLRPTNYARNIVHFFMAMSAVLVLQILPSRTVLALAASVWFVGAWSLEFTRRRSATVNRLLMRLLGPIAHPHEAYRVNSATWYATAIFLMSLFPVHAAQLIGLAVLGVGDPIAALVGRRYGRTKLVHGRSLEGSSAFVLLGTVYATALTSVLRPDLPLMPLLAAAATGATAGALAELFSRRIDDNLTVPVSAMLASAAALAALGVAG